MIDIRAQLKQAPQAIREFIERDDFVEIIERIAENYGLDEFDAGRVVQITTQVLLGITAQEQFATAIASALEIVQSDAAQISEELIRGIITPANNALREAGEAAQAPVITPPIGTAPLPSSPLAGKIPLHVPHKPVSRSEVSPQPGEVTPRITTSTPVATIATPPPPPSAVPIPPPVEIQIPPPQASPTITPSNQPAANIFEKKLSQTFQMKGDTTQYTVAPGTPPPASSPTPKSSDPYREVVL